MVQFYVGVGLGGLGRGDVVWHQPEVYGAVTFYAKKENAVRAANTDVLCGVDNRNQCMAKCSGLVSECIF